MNDMNKEILNKAIAHYGVKPQLGVAMEECAELIQAISKLQRYGCEPEVIENLVEEIADVLIMIEQIKIITDVTDDCINWAVRQKLNRLEVKFYE